MKTQLIILENKSLIVSDEEIKDGWEGYAYKHDVVGKIYKHKKTTNTWYNDAKKIIAGLENLPIIDYSALSDEDCKKIGYVDVDAIIKKAFYKEDGINFKRSSIGADDWIEGLKFGIKTAQSLNDKKFSLEDIFKILDLHTDDAPISYLKSELSKSLQQPKIFDIIGNLSDNKQYFIITQII